MNKMEQPPSAHCETVAETDFGKTILECLLGRLLAEHRNRTNCYYTWRGTIGRLKEPVVGSVEPLRSVVSRCAFNKSSDGMKQGTDVHMVVCS